MTAGFVLEHSLPKLDGVVTDNEISKDGEKHCEGWLSWKFLRGHPSLVVLLAQNVIYGIVLNVVDSVITLQMELEFNTTRTMNGELNQLASNCRDSATYFSFLALLVVRADGRGSHTSGNRVRISSALAFQVVVTGVGGVGAH